jgi:hypothetical protein|uniref:Uncharacterized protein n=1 Tax=Rhizobium rhizogenes TaxID=359 RepID=A0A7S4ZST2_RHIRH|nr:hypothetical protein pC5.8b_431 [Rhizobium rhizogenes]
MLVGAACVADLSHPSAIYSATLQPSIDLASNHACHDEDWMIYTRNAF